ncbi:MAG: CPBP family intramembrane glutamic endopeptidase [Acetivibrionales bacterium]|jgi:membrane protease YdiL (CAAX protease family)
MKKFFKGIGAAVGYFAIYFVINILVLFIGGIFVGLKEGIKAIANPEIIISLPRIIESKIYENALLLSSIGAVITLFVFWLVILISKKSLKERLELYPVSIKKTWPVIVLGLTLNLFISHLINYLPIPEHVFHEYVDAISLLGDEITVVQVLSVVIAAPVLEEVLYRGLIMGSLQGGMPVIVALVIQTVIFGLMHGQILWICYATFFGALLAIIKLRYKSLYPCILLHASFNGASYIFAYLNGEIYHNIFIFIAALFISAYLVILIFNMTNDTRASCSMGINDYCNNPDKYNPEIYYDVQK